MKGFACFAVAVGLVIGAFQLLGERILTLEGVLRFGPIQDARVFTPMFIASVVVLLACVAAAIGSPRGANRAWLGLSVLPLAALTVLVGQEAWLSCLAGETSGWICSVWGQH